MSMINAEITDEMEEFIDSEVSNGLYKSKSEYIRNKIKEDMIQRNGGEI